MLRRIIAAIFARKPQSPPPIPMEVEAARKAVAHLQHKMLADLYGPPR